MAKLTLGTITSAYQAVPQLNANSALIEAALENTLSRDGTTPNSMSADFDLNSNRILNSAAAIAGSDVPTYQQVQDLVDAAATGSIAGIAGTLVTVTDAGGFYTAIEVEGALQEIFTGQAPVVDGTLYYTLAWDGTSWAATDAIKLGGANSITVGSNIQMETATLTFDDGVADIAQINMGSAGYLTIEADTGAPRLELNIPTEIIGGLYFLQAANAPADVATYGQLWVRSDTPQTLMFTNEDGTDIPLTESGSFTGTLTGMTGATQGTVYYERVGSIVTMWIDAAISGTSNTTAMTMTGIPAAITPTTTGLGRAITPVIDTGNAGPSMTLMLNTSVISFSYPDAAWATGTFSSVGFTNSGSKGLNVGWTFTYATD